MKYRPVCAQQLVKEMLFGNQPRLAMVDMNASNQHVPALSKEIVDGFEQSVPPPQSIQAVRAHICIKWANVQTCKPPPAKKSFV